MREVLLFTDGCCRINPGPGGWAFILRDVNTGRELVKSGYGGETTNNRMELMAVIEGLTALTKPCYVYLYADSKYVLDGMSTWINNWKAKNWRKVKNVDLWKTLDKLSAAHTIYFHHIYGHTGHTENELCDKLALDASYGGEKA